MEAFLPDHIVGGVTRYIEDGIKPGGFLCAVISNDLKGAVARADHINIQAIPNIVAWFYNNAPKECWGSEDNFNIWLKMKAPRK